MADFRFAATFLAKCPVSSQIKLPKRHFNLHCLPLNRVETMRRRINSSSRRGFCEGGPTLDFHRTRLFVHPRPGSGIENFNGLRKSIN